MIALPRLRKAKEATKYVYQASELLYIGTVVISNVPMNGLFAKRWLPPGLSIPYFGVPITISQHRSHGFTNKGVYAVELLSPKGSTSPKTSSKRGDPVAMWGVDGSTTHSPEGHHCVGETTASVQIGGQGLFAASMCNGM